MRGNRAVRLRLRPLLKWTCEYCSDEKHTHIRINGFIWRGLKQCKCVSE
jgi:hypothetical protein